MRVKFFAFVFVAVCFSFCVFSEDWTCSKCDLPMNGNFCSNCGGARDVVKVVIDVPDENPSEEADYYDEFNDVPVLKEFNIISKAEALAHKREKQNFSDDRHILYIKDYVGRRVSDFGYTSLGGDRFEKYGDSLVKLNFIDLNGEYVNITDDYALHDYIVTAQSVEPNSKLIIVFAKDSDGVEYDSVIEKRNITNIDFIVEKVSGGNKKVINHIPSITSCSTDKHLFYIKDYVGRNLASVGYCSLGGDRFEKYGEALVAFNYITEDGVYIPFDDNEIIKKYIVKSQSVAPNTELKIVFKKDSNGNEFSLVDTQSICEIDLVVTPIDGVIAHKKINHFPVATKISTDKHLFYIKDYVGRNLATVGYSTWGGERKDDYGAAKIKIIFIEENGEYIPYDDVDIMKNYVIYEQNIAPNTELKIDFAKDSEGNEFDYSIKRQSVEEIELKVRKIK